MDPSQDWKQLYIKWITEVRDKAGERNAQFQEKNYTRALGSLRSADIRAEHPKTLKKLGGIGDKTIQILVDRAKKHCIENDLSLEWCEPSTSNGPLPTRAGESSESGAPKKKNTRAYIPRYGTTTYHILVGLYQLERLDPGQGFGKDAITRHIKDRVAENQGGSYSKLAPTLQPAFNMLNSKGLIFNRHRQYFLEEQGREVAKKFVRVEKDAQKKMGNIPSSEHAPPSSPIRRPEFKSPEEFTKSLWNPDEYTIKLLLDSREVSSFENRNGFKNALEALDVHVVVLPLPVGDCCWVAEHKASRRRAVLEIIIERKRLDDLVSSIIDGRFLEQKRRLHKSCLKHVIYLVEKVGGDREFLSKHSQRIQTAMSQCVTQDSFYLRETSNQSETVLYLQQMMKEIQETMKDKPIEIIFPNIDSYELSVRAAIDSCGEKPYAFDYDSFFEGTQKSRNKTIAEIFVTMLMAIKGISAEKALAIQEIYQTPRGLVLAYAGLEPAQRADMLMDSTAENPSRRKLNAQLSRAVYEQWGKGAIDNLAGSSYVPSSPLARGAGSPTSSPAPTDRVNEPEKPRSTASSERSIRANQSDSLPASRSTLGATESSPDINLRGDTLDDAASPAIGQKRQSRIKLEGSSATSSASQTPEPIPQPALVDDSNEYFTAPDLSRDPEPIHSSQCSSKISPREVNSTIGERESHGRGDMGEQNFSYAGAPSSPFRRDNLWTSTPDRIFELDDVATPEPLPVSDPETDISSQPPGLRGSKRISTVSIDNLMDSIDRQSTSTALAKTPTASSQRQHQDPLCSDSPTLNDRADVVVTRTNSSSPEPSRPDHYPNLNSVGSQSHFPADDKPSGTGAFDSDNSTTSIHKHKSENRESSQSPKRAKLDASSCSTGPASAQNGTPHLDISSDNPFGDLFKKKPKSQVVVLDSYSDDDDDLVITQINANGEEIIDLC